MYRDNLVLLQNKYNSVIRGRMLRNKINIVAFYCKSSKMMAVSLLENKYFIMNEIVALFYLEIL